ncbi:hypothetical protein Q3G72_026721 [Acer saccharum]|nr:hypothetical protein Q3G72_026721 [Acer saccharum]
MVYGANCDIRHVAKLSANGNEAWKDREAAVLALGAIAEGCISVLYPHLSEVTCGVRGKLDPPCNAVGYKDREVLGINHMYYHPAWRRSKVCSSLVIFLISLLIPPSIGDRLADVDGCHD